MPEFLQFLFSGLTIGAIYALVNALDGVANDIKAQILPVTQRHARNF